MEKKGMKELLRGVVARVPKTAEEVEKAAANTMKIVNAARSPRDGRAVAKE